MPYINLPPVISAIMDEFDKRIRRLETSYRFSVPVVTTAPAYPKNGDMWILSTNSKLYIYYNSSSHIIANL